MKLILGKTVFLVLCVWSGIAQAGVTVGGTRVIYDGAKREATLSVRNTDKRAFLIQAWVDDDGPDGDHEGALKPPFVVTPPLFRLDAGSENILRIIRSGGNLPEDREAVFWMDVKSIPSMPEASKNVLQIAVKTRIKMFWRPGGLAAPKNEDYGHLTFHRQGNDLIVTNPTPWFMSFNTLSVGGVPLKQLNLMAAPNTSTAFVLPPAASGQDVRWTVINDYGGESQAQTARLH